MRLVIALLFCLTHYVAGFNFKVAVVIEENAVNVSLIDLAVSRRVNSNWRLLSGHKVAHTTIVVPESGAQFAGKHVCSQVNLSALIIVGSCGVVSEMSFLARSLQLPFIGLPVALCHPQQAYFGAVGSHSTAEMIAAATEALASNSADHVVIFHDLTHATQVIQMMQNGLSTIGISSITFNVQSTTNQSQVTQLSLKINQLMKKRVFNAIVMATTSNALNILSAAANAGVMQQNYFWLIIDSGLSKSQLMSVCPMNCNLALLRGGTTGVNEAGGCSTAVRDVFEKCDTDNIRTLEVRVVDAIVAVAKALTTSLQQVSFQPSNASCFPLQPWSSGADVLRNILTLTNYDSDRGIISYNSTTGFFNAQGLEIVASFTERVSAPVKFVLSARFSNNTLTKIFRKRGAASFVFPNTFTGFGNATIVICAIKETGATTILKEFPNKTSIISGMHLEIIEYLAANMEFRFITKQPHDGQYGGPQLGTEFFTGCVGEVQRGIVLFAAGPFTKTTVRDAVIDFSSALYQESNALLLPRPKPKSTMWNVFLPLTWDVWLVLVASIFIAALFTWIFGYYSPFSAINLDREDAINNEASYLEYLWTIIGSFMLQGQEFYPNAPSPRMTLAFWWIFTLIVYSAYTAFLTSALTVTATEFSVRTLDDFLAQTTVKPVTISGTNIHTLIVSSRSGIYKQLADRLVESNDCIEQPFIGNFACIFDRSALYYVAQMNCTRVYLSDDTFNTATVAYVYPEDAYFGKLLDYHINKLKESGVMQRLYAKYYSSSDADHATCRSTPTLTGAEAIGLDTTSGTLVVTGGFFGTGLLFLGCEFLLTWLRRCRKK